MAETDEENTPVKTVLLVEDDADIRETLAQFLKEETAYQVISASDGFAALKLVRTITPHLIVLDYQLPGMTGLECLEALRATKGLEHTPVMLMSANFPRQVKADSTLVKLEKPFEMDYFLKQVKHLLDGEMGVKCSSTRAATNSRMVSPSRYTEHLNGWRVETKERRGVDDCDFKTNQGT